MSDQDQRDGIQGLPPQYRISSDDSLRRISSSDHSARDAILRSQRVQPVNLTEIAFGRVSDSVIAARSAGLKLTISDLLDIAPASIRIIKGEFVLVGDLVFYLKGALSSERTEWRLCGVVREPGVIDDTKLCTIHMANGHSCGLPYYPGINTASIGEVIDRFSQVDFRAETVLPYLA